MSSSGVSRPKIILCCGSDGRQYRQLCKGGDDMRQDAVMQQLFTLVNVLLSGDLAAAKRGLRCVSDFTACTSNRLHGMVLVYQLVLNSQISI